MNRFLLLTGLGILFVIITSFLRIFQSVTVSVSVPDVIEAGTEITVNVTINKGNVTGFGRFEQQIPSGFTVKSGNSANAIFNFQDQKLQLVWIGLPAHDEINISYVITANERLKGDVSLGGEFYFIENNGPRMASAGSNNLSITPSPRVSLENQIDVNDFARIASIESEALGSGSTIAFRQRPVWIEDERFYLVTLLINRDAARSYAKIEETIPDGFTAVNLDSKGGIFQFRNQQAVINWQNLPLESYFTISYRLIPNDGQQSPTNISGTFAFMITDRTFEIEIIERSEALAGMSRTQVDALLRDVNVRASAPSQFIASNNTPTSPSQNGNQPNNIANNNQTQRPSTVQPPSSPTNVQPSPPNRQQVAPPNNERFRLQPQEGIYYRVQIAAGRNPVNVPVYFRGHRVTQDVMWENHEGWFKYTVGPLSQYRDARDLRVNINNTTNIEDPFVVAYNDGRRITVQDALMALNQTWVK